MSHVIAGRVLSRPLNVKVTGGGGGRRVAVGIDGKRVVVAGNAEPRALICNSQDGGMFYMSGDDAEFVDALAVDGREFSISLTGVGLNRSTVASARAVILERPQFTAIPGALAALPRDRNPVDYQFTITLLDQ